MSKEETAAVDKVVEAVKQLNAGYLNTDYFRKPPEDLRSGKLYTVTFKGEDGHWRENYVFERGKTLKPYYSIRDMIKDSTTGIIPRATDTEFVKLMVISILTILFAVAVVWIVAVNPENKSLQVLTGLLGLTLGYFVGKGDKANVS